MVSASQLYACKSCERDEVLSLWRLVRFELVMTQNFKLRRTSTGAFFSISLRRGPRITVSLVKALSLKQQFVVTSAHGT
jgi:hypothetical protein